MSELPRPATPGRWETRGGNSVHAGEMSVEQYSDHDGAEQDIRAIAALPEWIARADRLEALLREALGWIPGGKFSDVDSRKLISRIKAELGDA